jgi:hypothetical protein
VRFSGKKHIYVVRASKGGTIVDICFARIIHFRVEDFRQWHDIKMGGDHGGSRRRDREGSTETPVHQRSAWREPE